VIFFQKSAIILSSFTVIFLQPNKWHLYLAE